MAAVIRLARPSDISAMHKIRTSVRENRLLHPGTISEDSYQPFIANNNAWVALMDSQVVGFAALDLQDASVWALFVSPGVEGMGVGRALHAAMVRAAVQSAVGRLRLTTDPGSRAAGFYARAGWQHAGHSTASGDDVYELVLI